MFLVFYNAEKGKAANGDDSSSTVEKNSQLLSNFDWELIENCITSNCFIIQRNDEIEVSKVVQKFLVMAIKETFIVIFENRNETCSTSSNIDVLHEAVKDAFSENFYNFLFTKLSNLKTASSMIDCWKTFATSKVLSNFLCLESFRQNLRRRILAVNKWKRQYLQSCL